MRQRQRIVAACLRWLAIAWVRQGHGGFDKPDARRLENRPGPEPSSEMMGLTLRIARKTLLNSEVERDISNMDHALNDLIVRSHPGSYVGWRLR